MIPPIASLEKSEIIIRGTEEGSSMPARDSAPVGSPCWADLWTSDVDASRKFYGELLGWEAQEPSPEFGGYFMFTRDGVPVAGGMGDMGDRPANNSWKVYLATEDIEKTVEDAAAAGAEVVFPPATVADLGVQSLIVDPTGAGVGLWPAGTFPGFTVLAERGTPSWFELLTRDHDAALEFYRSALGWDTRVMSDTDTFRYTVLRDPSGQGQLAGIMDAAGFLPEGVPAKWSIYWETDDVDVALAKARTLGGSAVREASDSPYGRIAVVADPTGAESTLHSPNE
jgi:predicted enzyme related to lactoylglutathione lyase